MNTWALQITSGVGPAEVRAFVARLAVGLTVELAGRGVAAESTSFHGEPEAPHSVTLTLVWDGRPPVDDLLGTHACVQRSSTRGRHARKRWFAGVTLHASLSSDVEPVNETDVDVTTCRSGGAGGQHVNKTNSAVMLHHRPSGIRVRCEGERSQHANRAAAMRRLAALLAERAEAEADAAVAERRRAHTRVVRGLAVRVWG